MATMNISLPDPMKHWIEEQAQSGRYSNVSDYIRDLVRREQERGDRISALRRLVDEGLASGVTDESMADIRERALRQAQLNG
jgi:antitoxin ParD1/3/4